MAKRPLLYAVPDPEPESLTLEQVIQDICMDAVLTAKTAVPPRPVNGFDIASSIKHNLNTLVEAYDREQRPDVAAL